MKTGSPFFLKVIHLVGSQRMSLGVRFYILVKVVSAKCFQFFDLFQYFQALLGLFLMLHRPVTILRPLKNPPLASLGGNCYPLRRCEPC